MFTRSFQRERAQAARTRARFEPLEDRRLLSFSPAASFGVGMMPQDVESADFNGDGRLDLAVANWWDGTVSVLPGNGDGTFQAARTSETGAEPLSMAAGDFDRDGRTDLVTANEYNLTVLLGNGDGTFADPSITLVDYGEEPASIAAGDMNGDGATDLVVTVNIYQPGDNYYGFAFVYLNNGDGTFNERIVNWLEWGVHTSGVVADFNGDGIQDFAAANPEAGGVTTALGDGEGNLIQPQYLPTDNAVPFAVTAGDLNGDGKTDMATANASGSASALLVNESGGFESSAPYGGWSGADAGDIVIGDFDRDGKADLATGDTHVNVLRGTGSGTFPTVESFAAGGVVALTRGDFNGDGWLDIATANPNAAAASVLINDRSWATPPPPAVFINDAAVVTEGNTGTRNATFTLTLSHASASPVTVPYATANVTAGAGSDYAARSGTVTIPAGQTSATFAVAVSGDRFAEPTETFAVNLSAPTNATVGDGQGIGTILDDEPRISIHNVSRSEGGNNKSTLFTFTVSLSAAYDQAVTVNYATANGTATAGSDYTSQSGTVTFAAGETVKTITVKVKGDKAREPNETFFVDLFGASGNALIALPRGIGTILNDDR